AEPGQPLARGAQHRGLAALELHRAGQLVQPAGELPLVAHPRSFRGTRLSPMRSVTRSLSKNSASGMVNLRLCPVSSLKPCASMEPFSFSHDKSRCLRSTSAAALNHNSSETRWARPAACSD